MNNINSKNTINKGFFGILVGIVILSAISAFLSVPNTASARTYTYYQPAPFSDSQDEYYSNNNSYSYNNQYQYNTAPSLNPSPYITNITPNSVTERAQIIKVTITGNGFIPTSLVKYDGQIRTSTYVSANRLVVQLNESDVARSGRYYITVTNEAPGGGFSNPISFLVNKQTTVTSSTTTQINQPNQVNNSAYGASALTGYESMYSDTRDVGMTADSQSYRSLTSNAVFGSNSFLPSGILQWILFIIILLAIVFVWRKFFGGETKYQSTPLKHA